MVNIIDFNNFDIINEEMHVASKRKLRDAIHDIMIDNLDYGEEMKLDELSDLLNEKYKIRISESILEKLLFEQWWRKDDYSIFREKDKKWLDVWPFRKTIERKKKKTTPPLGKSRRKIEKEERIKNTPKTTYYNDPYYTRQYPPKQDSDNKHWRNWGWW